MSEMLANQYFMARKYVEAESELEELISIDTTNKAARKKLIICYSQNHKTDLALEVFYNLILEDIDFIIDTDVVSDDCPCPELVTEIEESDQYKFNYTDKLKIAGMLWLYCNFEKSYEYFKKLSLVMPKDKMITAIIDVYNIYATKHI